MTNLFRQAGTQNRNDSDYAEARKGRKKFNLFDKSDEQSEVYFDFATTRKGARNLTIMLQPKKTKFRRMQKGRMKGLAQRGNQLAYGSFGIKALESTWITGRQIEAARQAITRYMKREGQIWIRIFPDKPITKKPAEVRMGKGKGNPEGFVAPVTPGRILFEAEGVPLAVAQEALRLGAQKLPITTKFIVRRDFEESAI